MSDEENRRREREAQDDALAAGRLATLERRLGTGPKLTPVAFMRDHSLLTSGHRVLAGTTGWILQFETDRLDRIVACVAVDRGSFSRWIPNQDNQGGTTETLPIPAGFLLDVPYGSSPEWDTIRVASWFLE